MKNRVGQKFGLLTVLEQKIGQRSVCRCDCGMIKEVSTSNLVSGNTRSCGCVRFLGPQQRAWEEASQRMVGQRFSRLVILEQLPFGQSPGSDRKWRCRCDCGNETIACHSSLFDYRPECRKKSCGCLQRENLARMRRERKERLTAKQQAMIGQRYGKLVVVSRKDDDTSYGRIRDRWLCRCDCGVEKIILGPSLRSGITRSCGCLMLTGPARSLAKHTLGTDTIGVQ